jgi:hypothetical protein
MPGKRHIAKSPLLDGRRCRRAGIAALAEHVRDLLAAFAREAERELRIGTVSQAALLSACTIGEPPNL